MKWKMEEFRENYPGKRLPGYIFGKYSYKIDDFPKNKWYNNLIIRRWKGKWKSEGKNGNRN